MTGLKRGLLLGLICIGILILILSFIYGPAIMPILIILIMIIVVIGIFIFILSAIGCGL